jgi:hypothetical protein
LIFPVTTGGGGDGNCTVSCHQTSLHHNQYGRCGLGLVHLGNGFRRGEERRGEERRGEERGGEREREREQNTRCDFLDTSYVECDNSDEKLPWAFFGEMTGRKV